MKPSASLARVDEKKEPCPQSWEMMNIRIRNPPASTASGTASHQDTFTAKYIRHHSATYGTRVSRTCHMADHQTGFWYLATMSFHAGRLGCCSALARLPARGCGCTAAPPRLYRAAW